MAKLKTTFVSGGVDGSGARALEVGQLKMPGLLTKSGGLGAYFHSGCLAI